MKICATCGVEKFLTEFNKNIAKKDGLQTQCRKCSHCLNKQYYLNNLTDVKARTRIRSDRVKLEAKDYLISHLETHPCVDCAESDIIVLDFDHVIGIKKESIANMIRCGHSLSNIKLEMEKCEVRCANCHRRKTAKDFNWYKGRYKDI